MNNQTVIDLTIDRTDRNHLKNIVKMCAKDDLRPAMNGVSLIVKDGYAEMCASDGHTLGILKFKGVCSKDIFIEKIINIDAIKSLLKAKASDIARLVVSTENTSTRVIINNKEVGDYPNVIANYPNYWSVVPQDPIYKTEISKNVIDAIKHNTKHMNNRSIFSPTYLDFSENEQVRISTVHVHLDFVGLGLGAGYTHLSKKEPYSQHGFTAENLNKVINCFERSCIMEYSENSRAYVFKYSNSDKLTVLLMPIVFEKKLSKKLSESNGFLFESLKSIEL